MAPTSAPRKTIAVCTALTVPTLCDAADHPRHSPACVRRPTFARYASPPRAIPGPFAEDSPMAVQNAAGHSIDPLAEQAATLLAKAMVTSHDRERLWQQFRDVVVAQTKELEEAPVRDALEDMERRGLSLDVVARVVHEKLAE